MKNISIITRTSVTLGLGANLLFVASAAPDVPTSVQGHWVAGTTSATTYWDRYTGQWIGGSGSGQFYEFDKNGRFAYYMLMEVRTGSMVTRARTNYKGTVTFSGTTFTLHVTSGHYYGETVSRTINRDMTAAERARMSKTYNWRMEAGPDGKPRFVVLFGDGSKFNFERAV